MTSRVAAKPATKPAAKKTAKAPAKKKAPPKPRKGGSSSKGGSSRAKTENVSLSSGSESDGPVPDPSSDAFRITFFDAPQRGDLVIEGEGAHCGGGSITVPSTIHRYLFPYQVEGVKWLWRQASSGRGGILADDMGLGKTLQTVAFFAALLGCTGSRRMSVCSVCEVLSGAIWTHVDTHGQRWNIRCGGRIRVKTMVT